MIFVDNTALEATERSLVGAAILDGDVCDRVDIRSDHFRNKRASVAWVAARSLRERGSSIDLTALEAEIAKETDGNTDWVPAFLGDCVAQCFPPNAEEYAATIRGEWLHRKIVYELADALEKARKRELVGRELLDEHMAKLSGLDATSEDGTRSVADCVSDRVRELEEETIAKASGSPLSSVAPTGIYALDEKAGGWPIGVVSIVAARPGMGKSSLGLATAEACASRGWGCHVFSLEDSVQAYSDRVLSRRSGVPASRIRSVDLREGDLSQIDQAIRHVRNVGKGFWLLDGRSGITADEIIRTARRWAKKANTRVVVVDYLQLLAPPRDSRRMQTYEQIAANMTALADAAKRDKVAYVVMSQLNRNLEQRDDKRPRLSDLRESGSIEERAKLVVGLHRGSVYGDPVSGIDFDARTESPPTVEEFERRIELHLLKNSNGPTGFVRAQWNGATTKIW